jgi:hypothetical protein
MYFCDKELGSVVPCDGLVPLHDKLTLEFAAGVCIAVCRRFYGPNGRFSGLRTSMTRGSNPQSYVANWESIVRELEMASRTSGAASTRRRR